MATPETPAQATETETPSTPAQVAPVVEEEAFDKERAMSTITKLREIEKQAKKDAQELATFKAEKAKRDEADLSEIDKQKKRAEEAEAKAAKIELEAMRKDAATEAGLPREWHDRLKGTTKEEILADALELAKTLPTLKLAPKVPATNPANAQTNETEVQKRERLFGAQRNVFDFDAIQKGGGGVVWAKPPES